MAGGAWGRDAPRQAFAGATLDDAFGLFGRRGFSHPGARGNKPPSLASAMRRERRLTRSASSRSVDKAALKARYKELVKRLHPDANSGDRSHEDQLREIINAYNYLRTAGLA